MSGEGSRDPNEITRAVIGAAITVHRELGPGLPESAYEACLAYQISDIDFNVERQKAVPSKYRDVSLDCGYPVDLLVEEKVIIEVKAVEKLEKIHEAQLMSHLRLTGCKVGLLIKFNVRVLKNGIRRIVLDFEE